MGYRQTAQDVMTTDAVTVDAGESVRQLAGQLLSRRLSNAPVVERSPSGERLVGFVSEKDVMQCLARGQLHAEPGLRIRQIMRSQPLTVSAATDIFTLAGIFMREGFRHLPVVDARGMLLGIVSRRDVLGALVRHYEGFSVPAGAGARLLDAPLH